MGFSNMKEAIDYCRSFLRDNPQLNELLEDYETTDAELERYINDAIDAYNSTPPLGYTTNLGGFPNNTALANWVASRILKSAAMWYERNRINYTDMRGVSTQLKDKAPMYLQMARMFEEEWVRWVTEYKMSLNLNSAYGSTTF